MNAICLLVDRLHAGYVGAYGNTWIETPAIDQLACESFLFDHMLIDSPNLDSLYRSYWQGRHALCGVATPNGPPSGPMSGPTLAGLLGSAGVDTTLLTDEPAISGSDLIGQFNELLDLGTPEVTEPASSLEQTHLAGCFTQIINWLDNVPRKPFLLWCHLAGLSGPWDAPLEFRRSYTEPDDPPPRESAETPELMLEPDYDPDLLLPITQAYAGQVSLLDTCLGALLEFLAGGNLLDDTLLMLVSARGYPLGEHRRVGICDNALYGELAHVPMMIRMPDSLGAAARSQALVEPGDIWATLLEWWKLEGHSSPTGRNLLPLVRDEVESVRDRLCLTGADGQRAIRTPAWYLRETTEPLLFAKPDDRWEANDVATRCHQVVDDLRAALSQFDEHLQADRIAELPPLDGILLSGLE